MHLDYADVTALFYVFLIVIWLNIDIMFHVTVLWLIYAVIEWGFEVRFFHSFGY
jgi:hypothetical protein